MLRLKWLLFKEKRMQDNVIKALEIKIKNCTNFTTSNNCSHFKADDIKVVFDNTNEKQTITVIDNFGIEMLSIECNSTPGLYQRLLSSAYKRARTERIRQNICQLNTVLRKIRN